MSNVIPLRHPDPAALIADFGHPQWPGWWLIMGFLVVLQAWMLFQPLDLTMVRPRPGQSRTVRGPGARTGRTKTTRQIKAANL